MLITREWQDEPEVFEAVAEALETSADLIAIARDERGEYGERGYIELKTEDGRRFRLSIHELV